MALEKITTATAMSAAQKESQTSSMRSHGVTSRSVEALPKHWISALFRKLQARYGHKWSASIDGIEEVAVTEWADVLAGTTGEQIAHGLESWGADWPPSAPEFRKACQGIHERWEHGSAAYRPFQRALPKPPPDKVKAKQALAEIRALMRGEKREEDP